MAAGYTNSLLQIQLHVRGGTDQPTGAEGMIWVKTAAAVTSWTVSPHQPGEAGEGMVWIVNGADNRINILRKNTVEVFPSGCKQWVGGSWKWMVAFLFLNGSWTQFSSNRLYLFSANNGHIAVTGGWSSEGYRQGPGSPSAGSAYDGPSIYCTGSQYHYEGASGTVLKIDMRNYRTLYADCISTSTANAIVFVCSDKNNFQSYAFSESGIPTTRSVIAVDVSYVAEGYVVFTSEAASNATSRVYEMWLE